MTDNLEQLRALIARANRFLELGGLEEEVSPAALAEELQALMEAKRLVRRLNVVAHAVGCALAVEVLRERHPDLHSWRQVPGAGAGRDVEGLDTSGVRVAAAEVKTTLLSLADRPGADQVKNWRKDFDRLVADDVPFRYFVVPTEQAAEAARRLAPAGVEVVSLLPDSLV